MPVKSVSILNENMYLPGRNSEGITLLFSSFEFLTQLSSVKCL